MLLSLDQTAATQSLKIDTPGLLSKSNAVLNDLQTCKCHVCIGEGF